MLWNSVRAIRYFPVHREMPWTQLTDSVSHSWHGVPITLLQWPWFK